METYFNDHQKHCQYKLHNLKNVHNCRNPVNSLNFVLRLDMNRWEFMVAKIASWSQFSLLKSTAGTCGLNCNGWYVIIEMKTQQRHFCMIALLITLCKMIQCSKTVEKSLVKWPLTWPLLHQYSRACFHLLFTFYDIKLVFIVILS